MIFGNIFLKFSPSLFHILAFAVKLVLGEDFLPGSVNVSPKAKETDPTALLHSDYSVGGHGFYAVDSNNVGQKVPFDICNGC